MKKTIITVLLILSALQVPLWPLRATVNELELKSPNGGEVWSSGETYFIKWKTSLMAKNYPIISVYLVRDSDPGSTWALAEVNAADVYYYKWIVPFDISSGKDYRIVISTGRGTSCVSVTTGQTTCNPVIGKSDFSDRSDKPFTITQLAMPEEKKLSLPDDKNPTNPPPTKFLKKGDDGGKKGPPASSLDVNVVERLSRLEKLVNQLLEEMKFLKKLFSFGLFD